MLVDLTAMGAHGPVVADSSKSSFSESLDALLGAKLVRDIGSVFELTPLGRMVATITSYPPGHFMRRELDV